MKYKFDYSKTWVIACAILGILHLVIPSLEFLAGNSFFKSQESLIGICLITSSIAVHYKSRFGLYTAYLITAYITYGGVIDIIDCLNHPYPNPYASLGRLTGNFMTALIGFLFFQYFRHTRTRYIKQKLS